MSVNRWELGLFSTSGFDQVESDSQVSSAAYTIEEDADDDDIREALTPERDSQLIIEVFTPENKNRSKSQKADTDCGIDEEYIATVETPKSHSRSRIFTSKRKFEEEDFSNNTPSEEQSRPIRSVSSGEEEILNELESVSTDTPVFLSQSEEFVIDEPSTPEKPKPRPVNHWTVKKQVEKYASTIDIDVTVCFVWKLTGSAWKAVVRDGDKFLSILEAPVNNQENQSVPIVGHFYRFTNLVILGKVVPTTVMRTCGYTQHSYYRILATRESKWMEMSVEDVIDLEHNAEDDSRLNRELQQLGFSGSQTFIANHCDENDEDELDFLSGTTSMNA